MNSLSQLTKLVGNRVLVRIDTDVELEHGQVVDDFRLRAALPTIRHLVQARATVTLIGHLGRPKGRVVESLRLAPVARRLAKLLIPGAHSREFTSENFDSPVWSRQYRLTKSVTLLENLRFDRGEETNESEFVQLLAKDYDYFVNESFATAHRVAASTVGVAEKLPAYAGLNLVDELAHLNLLTDSPARPFVLIVGGAKVSEKLGLLTQLLPKVDAVLTGGVVANMFLETQGELDIKESTIEPDLMAEAKKILASSHGHKIHLPPSVVWGKDKNAGKILDLGRSSVLVYKEILQSAGSVFWAGSLGMAEEPAYAMATKEIAEFLANLPSSTLVMVGGGDTAAAINRFKLLKKMSFVSTGGGAALEYLAGQELPGLKVLN